MSEVVENVSEQQNSAPSNEAAQPTEVVEEITNNVDEAVVAKAATADNDVDTTKDADESSPKPAAEVSTSPKVEDKPVVEEETPSKLTVEEETSKPAAEEETSTSPKVDNKKTPVSTYSVFVFKYTMTRVVQLTRLRDKAYLVLFEFLVLVVCVKSCYLFFFLLFVYRLKQTRK